MTKSKKSKDNNNKKNKGKKTLLFSTPLTHAGFQGEVSVVEEEGKKNYVLPTCNECGQLGHCQFYILNFNSYLPDKGIRLNKSQQSMASNDNSATFTTSADGMLQEATPVQVIAEGKMQGEIKEEPVPVPKWRKPWLVRDPSHHSCQEECINWCKRWTRYGRFFNSEPDFDEKIAEHFVRSWAPVTYLMGPFRHVQLDEVPICCAYRPGILDEKYNDELYQNVDPFEVTGHIAK
ncbi:hypothetical protein F5141DRAFT_1068534 [Pisolithus sp. B1]|nr:hypothetical protein F5141DRAFT_1068534 [Pisolithus sp. B1]